MHRSHITQDLLNYFDETDVRTREVPWTIEAQLLNAFSCSIEDLEARYDREVRASRIGQAPLNLDNRGVWHRVQIPYGVAAPATVIGVRNGQPVTLTLFDDLLPVPTGIEPDPSRASVHLATPELWSAEGTEMPLESGPFEMVLPNRIYFQLEGMQDSASVVSILVEGYPSARTYWVSGDIPVAESVQMPEEGSAYTSRSWQSIYNITVRGLPSGARLKACLLPMGLANQPDPMRPYADPAARDVPFRRSWSVAGRLIQETYFANRFEGHIPVMTYYTGQKVSGLAVEPNTYGLLAVTPQALLYGDRREPVPQNLHAATLTEEPLYGLHLAFDPAQPGDLRYISLQAVPYAAADMMVQYRMTVRDPEGTDWIITGKGDLARYTSNHGWLRGKPAPITLALPNGRCGTWLFTLECIDQSGRRSADHFPYLHAAFQPLASISTSALLPVLEGVAFDARERLWLWGASTLVPARLRYDAYVYDEESRSLYLTDAYDEVRLI